VSPAATALRWPHHAAAAPHAALTPPRLPLPRRTFAAAAGDKPEEAEEADAAEQEEGVEEAAAEEEEELPELTSDETIITLVNDDDLQPVFSLSAEEIGALWSAADSNGDGVLSRPRTAVRSPSRPAPRPHAPLPTPPGAALPHPPTPPLPLPLAECPVARVQVLLKLMIELQHEKLREIVGAKIEEQHEVEATKIPVIPSWIQVRPPLPSFERTRRPPGPRHAHSAPARSPVVALPPLTYNIAAARARSGASVTRWTS